MTYSVNDKATVYKLSTQFALKNIPTYIIAAYIGTLLFPILGMFALVNALKVNEPHSHLWSASN